MIPLQNQEHFEQLIGRADSETPVPSFCIVYFTAQWCGACKRLDLNTLQSSFPTATWYKCDIDLNDYTAGYCGIRSIPTFLVIQNKKIMGQLGDSRTDQVFQWLKRFV